MKAESPFEMTRLAVARTGAGGAALAAPDGQGGSPGQDSERRAGDGGEAAPALAFEFEWLHAKFKFKPLP